MDSIVEENGNSSSVDENGQTNNPNSNNINTSAAPPSSQQQQQTIVASVLTTAPNIVQYLPAAAHSLQPMHSVIQAANQSSVIQTASTNAQAMAIPKGNALFSGGKPNVTTVIHTTSSNAVQLPPNFPMKIKPEPNTQPDPNTNSEDSVTDDDSSRGRRDLTRRPSYHKIFTEITGPDISGGTPLQMGDGSGGMSTLSSTGVSSTGPLIHLQQQDNSPAFYMSNRIPFNTNNSGIAEDQTRKREIRLQKNREAARECRRKKKEYIKCLENRVAVLENQNKALIEELKSLKELYCQTKND